MTRRISIRSRKQRGIALLLTTLMMAGLLSAVGLAVDAGMLFVVRSRLGSAADSAALAAGRGVNLGNDVAAAQASATSSAQRFMDANFPSGYLGTGVGSYRSIQTNFSLQTDTAGNPNGILVVSVDAMVHAPVYFMRFWGVNSVPVRTTGTVTRRNLVMILVLDESSSMGGRQSPVGTIRTTLPSTANSCEAMVYSSAQFVDYFSPYDNLGMVRFNMTAKIEYPASTNFKLAGSAGVKNDIANLNCGGNTNHTSALEAAYQEIMRINQPLAFNVIVLFTDGASNGVPAAYPRRTSVDTRLGPAKNVSSTNPPDVPPGNRANCLDSSGTKTCINMPVVCTAGTASGVITQTSGFNVNSGSRDGLFESILGDSNTPSSFPSGCPSSGTTMTSQSLAYIPDTDLFGNSTHGAKDNWVMQVNQQCAPSSVPITAGNNRCKNIGGAWASYPGVGLGSNFFTAGPYSGKFRSDYTNAIGVASMNSAINQANRIRSDTTYKIRIDSIYLQGNGGDPVDRDFLAMISNQENIPALIYEPIGTPSYANPNYQATQQEGTYTQTVNALELSNLFAELASSLLRISQ